MTSEDAYEFTLLVSYYQILVYDASMDNPFNDWRREHLEQGFAWRDGSVAFKTLDNVEASVEVVRGSEFVPVDSAVRAIRVPFEVRPGATIAVATVGFERTIEVAPDHYALTYEHHFHPAGRRMACRFTFVPCQSVEPAILLADSALAPQEPLLMEADPAYVP